MTHKLHLSASSSGFERNCSKNCEAFACNDSIAQTCNSLSLPRANRRLSRRRQRRLGGHTNGRGSAACPGRVLRPDNAEAVGTNNKPLRVPEPGAKSCRSESCG